MRQLLLDALTCVQISVLLQVSQVSPHHGLTELAKGLHLTVDLVLLHPVLELLHLFPLTAVAVHDGWQRDDQRGPDVHYLKSA